MRAGLESVLGAIMRIVPSRMLLGTELGRWYSRSQSHKYRPGDVLVLSSDDPTFGVRPVAVVTSYRVENYGGAYEVDMYADRIEKPDYQLTRKPVHQKGHFKWNLEFLFRKVPQGLSPDEALAFYSGERANWGSVTSI